MNPGDTVPPHHEIMRRIDASERSVRWALDELRRTGVIVRRPGARTVVAGESVGAMPDAAQNDGYTNRQAAAGVDNRTVIAIAQPDGGIFDQAMQVLMRQGKMAKLAVHCRLMPNEEAADFPVPPTEEGPRGYILFRRDFLPLAEKLQAAGHRVVFVGTAYNDVSVEVPHVSGDQEYGGYVAVRHLLELGHRRIAFDFTDDYRNLRRWSGCEAAIAEAREEGLEIEFGVLGVKNSGEPDSLIAGWGTDPDTVRVFFSRAGAPTAIVSWNDDMAVKMLTLLQRAGLQVPEDVSLMGYDNLSRSATVHPALTTIDGALDQQIQAALRLLTQPNSLTQKQSIIVLPSLVQRESTASPANCGAAH
jgi:DNA-binding LacI/PurR family transcriptional regulator